MSAAYPFPPLFLVALLDGLWSLFLVGAGAFLFFGFWNFATVLIHELGHALPALMFTDGEVKVLVGADNTEEAKFKINLGRLKLYFIPLFSPVNAGLCMHGKVDKFYQNFIILVGGVSFTLTTAIVFALLVFNNSPSDFWKFSAYFFLALSAWQFVNNLYPSTFRLPGGKTAGTDGYLLRKLFQVQYGDEGLKKAHELYARGDLKKTADFLMYWEKGNKIRLALYDFARRVCLEAKRYELLLVLTDNYIDGRPERLKPDRYMDLATAYLQLGKYENALSCCEKVMYAQPMNTAALNKTGIIYYAANNKTAAEHVFKKVMKIGGANDETYLYIGLLRFNKTDPTEAEEWFQKAVSHDPNDANMCYFIAETYHNNGCIVKAYEWLCRAEAHGIEKSEPEFPALKNIITKRYEYRNDKQT